MSQDPNRLYHISDQPGIIEFSPRPSRLSDQPFVWAIDYEHLPNYLLPRDCPRVTFYAMEGSNQVDIDNLMGGTSTGRVIAIESTWFSRIRRERIYKYEFDVQGFTLNDDVAGYYVSERAVFPVAETVIDDILDELLNYHVELRIMPSLWKLREAVIHSTLGFSLIRMKNAAPPAEGYGAYTPLP